MKTIVTFTFVAGLMVSPVILLQTMVMPQLDELHNFYGSMDTTVEQVAEGAGAPKVQQ